MAVNSLTRDTLTNVVKYNSALAGNTAWVDPTADFLITETILTGTQATVTFDVSSLASQGYKHLQIRYVGRSTFASHASSFALRFNSDSGTNYSQHRLLATGTAVASDAATTQNFADVGYVSAASATTGNFGVGIIDILDSFSTNKYKTTRVIAGVTGTTNRTGTHSSSWQSTSAVTSVTIWSYDGNLDIGSRFSIYGSKG